MSGDLPPETGERHVTVRFGVVSSGFADAAAEIMDNLYRRDIGELCRLVSGLLSAAATLVGQVQVRVLSCDADTPALRGLAETVLADIDSQRNAMTAASPVVQQIDDTVAVERRQRISNSEDPHVPETRSSSAVTEISGS